MFSFFKRQTPQPTPAPEPVAPPVHDAVVDAVLISGVVLPPYPAILAELDRLLARDDFELPRMVDVVARDPSLRAALLRVANSPVFGLRQPVSGLLQAITILGLARARAVMRSEVLRDALREYGDPALVQSLWARFAAIGNLAASLAHRSPVLHNQADLAYTVGMFHATGVFILAKRHPAEIGALAAAGKDFVAVLDRLSIDLASDPVRISAMIARNWHLPPVVSDAIALQRRPEAVPGSAADPLISLLRLAIALHDGGEATSEADALGLDAETLAEVRELQAAA